MTCPCGRALQTTTFFIPCHGCQGTLIFVLSKTVSEQQTQGLKKLDFQREVYFFFNYFGLI